jgi:cyclophilin family peptidyl-prolyl cis-trans isomerase
MKTSTVVMFAAVVLTALASAQTPSRPTPGAGPTVVVETVKGTFEFETYPEEAPKTVAHILALVQRGFYNGQRIHRVVPGFVIQMGDPQTRDMTKQASWGRGPAASSGQAVGVAEFSKKRTHGKKGTVSMAYAGDANATNAATADSQFFITLAPRPELNGKYAVFGQVTNGLDVLAKLQVGDVVRKVTVK